jgi:peptidoglycan hydrolase-like protein with peptidoglycan-binding domain
VAAAEQAVFQGWAPVAELSIQRVVGVAALTGALAAGIVAGAVSVLSHSGGGRTPASSSGDNGSMATAPVVRTTLTNTVQVGGSLAYQGSYAIAARSRMGTTYTALPAVGDVIREDQAVYALDNQPVPLLYGAIPAYRTFQLGMSDGTDVRQLTRDLIARGFGAGLSQTNHFASATNAAVKRWQRALGLPVTGKIPLGEVVFEPGPIRVTSVSPSVGAAAGGGTVLTATSTTPIVTVDLDVSEEYLVKPGDAVTVVLPDGTSSLGGRIETVGSVATCPGGGGTGLGGGSGSSGQSPCESAGSGSSSTPTVPVSIALDHTPPGARLDQAPVNVAITTQRANHVLAVPVNALLALAGGGFGVQVVTGKNSHLVGVTTGLYSSTLVQVSGSGIRPGVRVEVPAS